MMHELLCAHPVYLWEEDWAGCQIAHVRLANKVSRRLQVVCIFNRYVFLGGVACTFIAHKVAGSEDWQQFYA